MRGIARSHKRRKTFVVVTCSRTGKMKKMNSDSSNESVVLQITESALAEFMKNGKVTSARCDKCGNLIELSWLNDRRSAVSIKCPCGKFHGALRGLLG